MGIKRPILNVEDTIISQLYHTLQQATFPLLQGPSPNKKSQPSNYSIPQDSRTAASTPLLLNKMKPTTLFTTLFATAAFAAPAPAPAANPVELEARAQNMIDLWDNAGFLGIKFTGAAEVDQCRNFSSQFNNYFSSGKAKPGFRCTVWVNTNCAGTGFSFNSVGGDFPAWINNQASSWKCVVG